MSLFIFDATSEVLLIVLLVFFVVVVVFFKQHESLVTFHINTESSKHRFFQIPALKTQHHEGESLCFFLKCE